MKIEYIETDIQTLCVTAKSFPQGIKAAFQQLNLLLGDMKNRKVFGISFGSANEKIIYKAAAAEQYKGEAEKYYCETFLIKKGTYLSQTLTDWQKDETIVAKTFAALLKDPRIDSNGYCLELHINEKDMKCLVLLDKSKTTNKH